jgi:hypothetical protein
LVVPGNHCLKNDEGEIYVIHSSGTGHRCRYSSSYSDARKEMSSFSSSELASFSGRASSCLGGSLLFFFFFFFFCLPCSYSQLYSIYSSISAALGRLASASASPAAKGWLISLFFMAALMFLPAFWVVGKVRRWPRR